MPEFPLPELTPVWWAALSLGTVLLVMILVLAAGDLSDAVQARAWPRVAVSVLAALAAWGAVLLLAIRFELLRPFWK